MRSNVDLPAPFGTGEHQPLAGANRKRHIAEKLRSAAFPCDPFGGEPHALFRSALWRWIFCCNAASLTMVALPTPYEIV